MFCLFVCFYKEDLRYAQPDEYTLEIKNVTRKHAGVYTAKCSNAEGENQTSVMLDIQCKILHSWHLHLYAHNTVFLFFLGCQYMLLSMFFIIF